MDPVFEDFAMIIPNFSAPLLSEDLQAVIGMAIVDGAFRELLLANPRRALAGFEMSRADRRAAHAIAGAGSLAEYAVRLEQRLAGARRDLVAVGRAHAEDQAGVRKAS